MDRPIVVTAMPRSGSHLLRAVLNAHSAVYIASGSSLIDELANPQLSWASVVHLLQQEREESQRTEEDLLNVLRQLHHAFWTTNGESRKKRFERWGFLTYEPRRDDGMLRRIFPRMCKVFLVRDGRSVVASWMANWKVASWRMPKMRRHEAEVARLWVDAVSGVDSSGTLVIRLEDMQDVSRRAAELDRLRQFCGLSPSIEMERFVVDLPWVNVEKTSVERWRTDLSSRQLRSVFGVHGFREALASLRYPPA